MNKYLCTFLLFAIVILSCENSKSDKPNTIITTESKTESYEALTWLQSIFKCETQVHQFCFPNEEKVLTKNLREFLIESNQFLMNSYDMNSIDKNYFTKKLKNKWPDYAPLKEETWAFGRGNGDIEYLKNVEIEPLGNLRFLVKIDFTDDFSTDNEVKLVKTEKGFFINSIETKKEISSTDIEQSKLSQIEKFTQKWIWIYLNEADEDLMDTYSGEMSVFYNPETKKWLFTKDSYGNSGEMVNWVIGDNKGNYTYSFQSTHNNDPNSIMVFSLEEPQYIFELEEIYKPLNNTKIFNKNSEFGEIIGKQYQRIYPKSTINSTRVYLGKTDADLTALYGFDKINSETKLLFPFDLNQKNMIYLEEKTIFEHDKKKIEVKFKGIFKVDKVVEIH